MGKGTVERTVHTFRTEGVSGVWQKAWDRLSEKPVHRRLLVLELPFLNGLPVVEPRVPVTFEELTESDFAELIALRPFLTEEVIKLRLRAGHRFYVGKLNGRIVYTCLVAVKKAYLGYLGIAFPLSPQEVYFGEAYTVPECRRNHLHSACISLVSRTMHQLGYRHVVALVYPRNLPALRSFKKVGFQKKGHIGTVEIFGIRRYWYWARDGGFDCLNNAFLVPMEQLVPAELQGQIW